jgi:hypothetical protein
MLRACLRLAERIGEDAKPGTVLYKLNEVSRRRCIHIAIAIVEYHYKGSLARNRLA